MDEDELFRIVTINLDGLSRDAIIDRVITAMRDVGTPERDIEGFRESAINADYETMLAKAIGWQAPVSFVKDGQPWVRGDWRRLSKWQRVKRRWALWGGSHTHPDGTTELDIDEEAGVDPRDSKHIQDEKITAYIRKLSARRARAGAFLVSSGVVWVGSKTGMATWELVVVFILIFAGLHMLAGTWLWKDHPH